MAETKVMDVEVVKLTKFGFQNEKSEYVGYSNYMKDTDKAKVVPGRKFSVEMYIADSGSQKINKILKQLETAQVNQALETAKVIAKVTPGTKEFKSANETMSKAEWSAKDRSQLIGGLSHDSATLVAAMLAMRPIENTSEVIALFSEVLNGLLQVRDSLK